jgi:hypothetical protein
MQAHECYHCKQWIEEGEAHDCWTTTEAALTRDLSEDLRDAWERLRETAAEFGEQRIYASHHSIMFSRKSCYFFVRPKRKYLEVCIFLGRRVHAPQVKRVDEGSKTKQVHTLHITHRDEVETPITGWLREAYDLPDVLAAQARTQTSKTSVKATGKPPAPKQARKAVKTRAVKKTTVKKAAAKKTAARKAVMKAVARKAAAKKAAKKTGAPKKAAGGRATRR